MQVHRDLGSLPPFTKAVITIGTFDGVHRGHQKIIQQVKEEAKKCGGESVLITFDPHPRQVLSSRGHSPELLNSLDEKILLLEKHQIDHLIVVPFTNAFSKLSATEYVEDFLVEKIHPHIIVIGYDHHFGHNREGNIHLLRQMESHYQFRVEEIPEQIVHDITISSTRIREYLKTGQTGLANELLGYPYFISGKVVHGDKRGRKLGFPTANIQPGNDHKLIPAEGTYSAKVVIPSPVLQAASIGTVYKGAANIGHAPTFNGTRKRVEVYIINFNNNIYGSTLLLQLYHFIRPDKKFTDALALKSQMQEDVENIRKALQEVD